MRPPADIKSDLVDSLNHLKQVVGKLRSESGKGKLFTFPDAHKLSEGIILSGWTHWEAFIREILTYDVATDNKGALCGEITKFRTKGAPGRLAERIVNHPDSPEKWVEWNYNDVVTRANAFLGSSHRYPASLARGNDLTYLKRIRNGIAHKSDKARDSFLKLVSNAPFSIPSKKRSGITVGRFLFSHKWNTNFVLEESIKVIEDCCNQLIP